MVVSDLMLDIRHVSVFHGPIHAVCNVSLEVFRGEIVALCGANGSGKTTLLETIMGAHVPEAGEIVYKGQNIQGLAIDRNVRRGLYLVPEGRGVFASMSVEDNLLLGAHYNLKSKNEKLQRVFHYFPILAERRNQMVAILSGGERQMLSIARALMSSPNTILVDEPSLGLAPVVVDILFDLLVQLSQQGISILLAEQNVYKALQIAKRGYVLETGTVIHTGLSKDLLHNNWVCRACMGG